MKSLLAVLGLPAGPLRKPQKHLSGAALQNGLKVFQELGLADIYGLSPINKLAAAE